MVDGQFIIRDHKVLPMDEERIIREADAVWPRVWAKSLESGALQVPRLPRP